MLNKDIHVQVCDATKADKCGIAGYIKKYIFLCIFKLLMVCSLFAQPYPKQLIVAANGSGNYTTIQAAVDALRAYSPERNIIFIKKGIYNEKVTVPAWVTNVSFIGEDRDSTVIVWQDYSGKFLNADTALSKKKITTFTSYTMYVQGNDISIENITIKNAAGRVGQAVALHVDGDKVLVKNCNLIGNQDTLLAANDNSKQYYIRCFIEGTTDFIFGAATAVFDSCIIKSLSNSYITAASTSLHQPFGFVFLNCKLIASKDCTREFLGRPWRAYAKVAFINCEMNAHIVKEGWHNWDKAANEKTAFFAESNNFGEGAKLENRVKWSVVLSKKQLKKYTLENILKGWKVG